MVEHQNERLLEQNTALSQRRGETEQFVAEYQKITRIGRGYILGVAMGGTGFGARLSSPSSRPYVPKPATAQRPRMTGRSSNGAHQLHSLVPIAESPAIIHRSTTPRFS
ncbi:hypothetical protein [Martelella mediterranea]|uniref:hypothetical protein n=1 Tax=Martelella mediterranea TaxID=293089 RepID=UPI0010478138|nr:hypothetical protein [Martelella mediterranea]